MATALVCGWTLVSAGAAGLAKTVGFAALPTLTTTGPFAAIGSAAAGSGSSTPPNYAPPAALTGSSADCISQGIDDSFTLTIKDSSTGVASDDSNASAADVKYFNVVDRTRIGGGDRYATDTNLFNDEFGGATKGRSRLAPYEVNHLGLTGRVTAYLVTTKRQRQILDIAARLFAERGFHGVSVHDIGAACGITGRVLNHPRFF